MVIFEPNNGTRAGSLSFDKSEFCDWWVVGLSFCFVFPKEAVKIANEV